MSIRLLIFAALNLICFYKSLQAQNLENIGKANPISVTGGVSLNQVFYAASGIQSRRAPYTYFASGNVNFSLYGWSVPLSFSLSNQGVAFQQPFNQYSLHPTYKWITAHIGYTSMSYSPYTVGGHIFLGGAVDIAPEGNWKFSALYGRFLRAVEPDTINKGSSVSYRRMGYGFKGSYGSNGKTVELILFHAKDDFNSIHYVPDSLGVLPQENLVVSIGAGATLFKHFQLRGELANSAISRDVRAETTSHSNALANTGFLYSPRVSSSYYKAIKGSFSYQLDGYTLGLGYERVDPQYRTLGAYYFNSDLENITINVGGSIGKLSFAGSLGKQRDNLDDSKVSTMRRAVGSVNVNYTPSQRLNVSASYSTFQTYTNIRSKFTYINQLTPYDNLDTLNYTQICRNASLSAMYALSNSKEKRQSVNLNLSVQNAADKQGEVSQNSGNRFYNINTSYSLNLVPRSITLSIAFNGNVNDSPGFNTQTIGPTASVTKSFFDKKLRATLSSSYNSSYTNSQHISSIVNGRINGAYTIQKKHNLNLGLVVVTRDAKAQTSSNTITEFTGTLGYGYSFGSGR